MAGSTTESVGASTAEISGVFGRGGVENESLAAFGEVKCAGRSGGSGKGRHGFAARVCFIDRASCKVQFLWGALV